MSVLYEYCAMQQYRFILGIQLTTDVFVPDDGPVRTETCSSHRNKPMLRVILVYLIKYCCVEGQIFSR
jgi:hypothetical protein